MAEVVKHALIADAGLFSYLEENGSGVLDLTPAVMERLVCDSATIKSSIVNRDEREQGERRLLNFGIPSATPWKGPPGFPTGGGQCRDGVGGGGFRTKRLSAG